MTRLAGGAEPAVEQATGASGHEWSRSDVARLVVTLYLLFASVVLCFDDWRGRVTQSGDNWFYASDAAAIRGNPQPGLGATHFLGYPLLVAPVAALFRISEIDALPIVSLCGSLVAIGLAGELWGAWVAAWFAVVNLDWIQRSLLGGADPPFAALVFAALLCARKEHWRIAATFGALATTVRPFGVFSLFAIGVVLLWRKRYLELALAIAISVVVSGLYLALVHSLFGASLANVAWYRGMGLGHDRTFIPFVTLFFPTAGHELTWKNVLKTAAWTSITLMALAAAVWRKEARTRMRSVPVEWVFAATYAASFLFFPAWWIEGEYPRYFGPVVPLCLVALQPWVPKRRSFVWMIGVAFVLLAAIEDMPVFPLLVDAVLRFFPV